ncbi:MAG: M24 family metallopeptidase [Dehalococcoidia bacterium]
MNQLRVFQDAQEFLTREQLPGWLIHDYRDSNPIFRQVVTPLGHVTRPCLLYIPARGIPTLLVHHVDAGKFAPRNGEPESTPKIKLAIYRNRQTMVESLRQVLSGATRVAMEYSPNNELPRVSRVDAGTVELVRSLGPEVVSSADLMQFATQRWTSEQLAGHQRAAEKLGQIVNQAFQNIGQPGIERPGREQPRSGRDLPTEFEIAEFIRRRFAEEGLEAADGPIVSINAHCSDPHYEPMPEGSSVIHSGDWVLIDLWAKENRPNSVYADITWVAYVGDQVPERHQAIFDIVIGARDAALIYLQESYQQGLPVQGWQADQVARQYIEARGYGEFFTHRLGHSISYEVHGEAVNLDGFETHDTRQIIPGIGFSIEPGIYLPEFGVRSEIDAYMSEAGPFASSPVQREVVLIGER